VHFKIELCFWHPRALPPWELGVAGRVKKAVALKEQGSTKFKAGNHKAALTRYRRATRVLKEDGAETEAKPVLVALWNNMALCQIRLNRAADAIESAEEVLKLEPENAKAHFRLGDAYAAQKEYALAKPMLTKAAELEPKNAAIQKAVVRVEKAWAAEKAKEKKLYAGMFG
jgi:tetratricopeptide (TPR) repeat protein